MVKKPVSEGSGMKPPVVPIGSSGSTAVTGAVPEAGAAEMAVWADRASRAESKACCWSASSW